MIDLALIPASLGRSRSVRGRLMGAVLTLLALFALSSAAPASLTHLPGVGAVVGALTPDVASADSNYSDEGCVDGTTTWVLHTTGTSIATRNWTCNAAGADIALQSDLTWSGGGIGATGGQDIFEFNAPSGLTLSNFNATAVNSWGRYGFGGGMMGDTGSGLFANNDPRNFAKGQAIPNNTVGQSADCWGYGDAHTQVVTTDHSDQTGGLCIASFGATSYNLTGQHFVALGIGAESRDCGDTADGGNCETGEGLAEVENPVVQVDDPANGPTFTGFSVGGLPAGYDPSSGWVSYQSDSGTITGSATAEDSGGVCNVQVTISGPSGTVASGGNAIGTLPAGYDQSTGRFTAQSGSTPAGCARGTSAGSSPLSLAGLPSGTYTVAAQAQNPGNVVGSGATSGTSSTFNVDNQVPTVTIAGGTGQWFHDTPETYNISGSEPQDLSLIASITCTGAGLPAGGQTFPGSSAEITETAQGDDAISCYATTNAGVSGANGANVNSNAGTEGQSSDILIDTANPSLGVDNDSPASQANGLIGNWVDPANSGDETVDVYATAGVSGLAATTNGTPGTIAQWSTSGSPITTGPATQTSLDNIQAGEDVSSASIDGDTYGMPYCIVTDLSDPTTPGGSDYVRYNAATGGNVGDGTNPAATPQIDADSKYVEWQIPFTQNGHYQIDCTVTNGAGVTATLATQTIEVDQTNSADLQQAADLATASAGRAVDATGGNAASNYVSTVDQSTPPWSGDPLTLTYTPAAASSDWPTTADPSDTTDGQVDPVVKTVCTPGGQAGSESPSTTAASLTTGPTPAQTDPNSVTIGQTTWQPQPDDKSATRTPAANGNDEVTCTETNAAGTTSDPTTYYMNIDQQTPMVAYDQPAGDTGGQDSGSAASAAMTPAALSAKTGLPKRDFSLAPLTSKVAATANDPVPATGHLAPSGPAEFKLSPHGGTTGVQYSDTATQVDATANELSDQSGVYGEYCSDTNQTETGPSGNVPQPYADGGALGAGGTTATLNVPEPTNTTDAVTGIHYLDCHGADKSTYAGNADGPLSGSSIDQYPFTSNQTQYHYTVNIDNVSPATIGWGIVNRGETVTNPDPYSFDPGQWYQDEATLTATAQAVGNDLSDISGMVCAVNDPTFGQPNSTYTNPVTGAQVPYYDYTLDGAASEHPTDANNDYTVEVPVSDDNGSGTYYLSCFAVSGSGVNGTVSTTEVNLQSSSAGVGGGGNCDQFCIGPVDPSLDVPPSGIGPIPGGQQWHTTAQQVPVVAQSPAGSAPIESITCAEPPVTLDGDTTNLAAVDNGDGTITYPNPAGTNSNTESITVTVGPPPVGLAQPPVECYATDAAGVEHTLGSYQVNVDNTAPTGYFIRPNAIDPRKVTLYATDNSGSGIGKVLIQLVDGSGKIASLPLTSNTTGDGDYTAELLPDNQMAKGSYTLQAVVTDNAGNVTNPPLDQWQRANGSDGGTAVISYPLLGSAKMIDALGAGTAAPLLPGDKGTTSTRKLKTKKSRVKVHGKWVSKTVPVYKVTRVKKHGKWVKKSTPVYVTVKAVAKVQLASVKTPIKLAYRGQSTADGLVTTGAGVPVVGGKVQVTQTVDGAATVIGTATTNGSGRWVYHVPAGASRQLGFEYMGTALIDTASGTPGAELVTGGTIALKVPKSIKVGKKLVLTGSLPGGYIPAQGVALRVYYTEKGAKGTGDYPTTYHTDAKGRFTIKEPSRKTARGHTYTFWVQAVTPSPWAYQGAASKKLTVKFK
ncbi:MAG TPA: hypothetical protein VHZ33_02180 [Trebonia sp.]|jgi:5-hydroxyisourate hydrolase-like protein (transthyretin family)|nr:hypothetical protein [Trebonia sp.]